MSTEHSHHIKAQRSVWKNPLVIVCLAIVGYWLFTYHSQHLLGWLPYLILLLCPLMHIFMHGGHGHGGHGGGEDSQDQKTHQHHQSTEKRK